MHATEPQPIARAETAKTPYAIAPPLQERVSEFVTVQIANAARACLIFSIDKIAD
jgi:hypothetical protein